jgi:hypothetical protein
MKCHSKIKFFLVVGLDNQGTEFVIGFMKNRQNIELELLVTTKPSVENGSLFTPNTVISSVAVIRTPLLLCSTFSPLRDLLRVIHSTAIK